VLFALTFLAFICFAVFSHVGAVGNNLLIYYSAFYVGIFLIFCALMGCMV